MSSQEITVQHNHAVIHDKIEKEKILNHIYQEAVENSNQPIVLIGAHLSDLNKEVSINLPSIANITRTICRKRKNKKGHPTISKHAKAEDLILSDENVTLSNGESFLFYDSILNTTNSNDDNCETDDGKNDSSENIETVNNNEDNESKYLRKRQADRKEGQNKQKSDRNKMNKKKVKAKRPPTKKPLGGRPLPPKPLPGKLTTRKTLTKKATTGRPSPARPSKGTMSFTCPTI
uniref:Uncharacterized protein n=1 Tax=Strongyloides papillosus TaxID=174720 RepID=A0A0N5C2N5_STREA